MKYKTLSTKDYVKLCIESYNDRIEENKKLENQKKIDEIGIQVANEGLFTLQANNDIKRKNYHEFTENTKIMLLSECIYKVFDEALGIHKQDTVNNGIKRNLVDTFIRENGVNNLLGKFKTRSLILAEFAALVDKYYNKILETVENGRPETYVIDPSIKNDFFSELDMENIEDVTDAIRTRVANAIEEFITTNTNNKLNIEDTIKTAQEKIDSAKTDEVRESYEYMAKKKIATIKSNTTKNVFFEMVTSMSEQVLSDETLKKDYMKNNRLDMDKIVEKCEIIYTFLETVNTMKLDKVDEEYIKNVLDTL